MLTISMPTATNRPSAENAAFHVEVLSVLKAPCALPFVTSKIPLPPRPCVKRDLLSCENPALNAPSNFVASISNFFAPVAVSQSIAGSLSPPHDTSIVLSGEKRTVPIELRGPANVYSNLAWAASHKLTKPSSPVTVAICLPSGDQATPYTAPRDAQPWQIG